MAFLGFLSPVFRVAIKGLYNLISNYGWTIVIFTVALKIITIPLDIWVKISSKKTQFLNLEIAPEMEKLKMRYGNNRNEFQQKQMELYKKHGFSPVGGCLPVIVNILIMLFLYVSMYSAMNIVSVDIAKEQYIKYNEIYETERADGKTEEQAQDAVYNYYLNDKKGSNSFLWIKNISYKDANIAPVASFADFKKTVGGVNVDQNSEDVMTFDYNGSPVEVSKTNYDLVMSKISTNVTGNNGYFILPILVIAFSFLASFIPEWIEKIKLKGVMQAPGQNMLLMKLLMPALLGVLCFTTSATFGIYLLSNTLIGILTGFIVDPIANGVIKKFILKKKDNNKPKISYSR